MTFSTYCYIISGIPLCVFSHHLLELSSRPQSWAHIIFVPFLQRNKRPHVNSSTILNYLVDSAHLSNMQSYKEHFLWHGVTLVLSAEWRVSNCAKIHPLRRLRDNVSLEAVAGGIRGGKGGKSRGEEEEKGRQRLWEMCVLGRLKKRSAPWESNFNIWFHFSISEFHVTVHLNKGL